MEVLTLDLPKDARPGQWGLRKDGSKTGEGVKHCAEMHDSAGGKSTASWEDTQPLTQETRLLSKLVARVARRKPTFSEASTKRRWRIYMTKLLQCLVSHQSRLTQQWAKAPEHQDCLIQSLPTNKPNLTAWSSLDVGGWNALQTRERKEAVEGIQESIQSLCLILQRKGENGWVER